MVALTDTGRSALADPGGGGGGAQGAQGARAPPPPLARTFALHSACSHAKSGPHSPPWVGGG